MVFSSKRHQDRVDPAPDHVDSKGVAVEGTMRFLLVLVLPLRDLPTQTVCIQKYFGGNWTLSVWWSQSDVVELIHWHQNTKTWEDFKFIKIQPQLQCVSLKFETATPNPLRNPLHFRNEEAALDRVKWNETTYISYTLNEELIHLHCIRGMDFDCGTFLYQPTRPMWEPCHSLCRSAWTETDFYICCQKVPWKVNRK